MPTVAIGVLITQCVSHVKGCHYMQKFIAAKNDSTHAHQIRYVALQWRVTVQLPLQLHSGPSTSCSFFCTGTYINVESVGQTDFLSDRWSLFWQCEVGWWRTIATYHAVHFPTGVRRLDDVTFWGHMSRHDVTSFSNITSYKKSRKNFKSGYNVCYLHNRKLAEKAIDSILRVPLLLFLQTIW